MNTAKFFFLFVLCFLFFLTDSHSHHERIDRQPAVAGSFYPAQQEELRSTLKQLCTKAIASHGIKDIIAIISPHAGYVFSGEVAASSLNQIDTSKEYENIFLLGSSHHVGFEGASIYSQGNFITPLGTVKVNTELANLLIKNNAVFSNRRDVHATEHSLEVQLPFLQYRLKKYFKIVPIIIGTQSPKTCKDIAKALQPYLNPKNLFIISTDFSHYPTYAEATDIDKATADVILTNSAQHLIRYMSGSENKNMPHVATVLCGWTSVLTLMYMTENHSEVLFTHIQYKNSGDTNYGDKNRVVGYHAIVVSLKEKKEQGEFFLSGKDKKDLLAVARSTIEQYVLHKKKPELDENNFSPTARINCGAFVTLKNHGDLRGCIGRFDASEPLYKVVQNMAIASATQDNRFSRVAADEIPELDIEISVLTPMRRIKSMDEIQLGKHGLYMRKGYNSGTFLPQVAAETGWTKEEFLGHCAQDKAGIGWNGWKDAELYVYEALVFGEKELKIK